MNLGQGFQVLLPWHDGPEGGATSNGRLVLRLEGGAAFGLGDHPTTQGAVKFLEKASWGMAKTLALLDWMIVNDRNIPSGYVKIAIENGHRNSGFSHEKWWIFP